MTLHEAAAMASAGNCSQETLLQSAANDQYLLVCIMEQNLTAIDAAVLTATPTSLHL